jgi:hypothetical protein
MQTASMDAFEKPGLDLPKTDSSEKLDSLHDNFTTEIKPINGYFGYLAADAADGLPKWPQRVLDRIGSPGEAKIYKGAGLRGGELNGKEILMRKIDPNLTDADGVSNMQRMARGRSPIDAKGESIELHHIGQKNDSPLAELKTSEHRGEGNDKVLHSDKRKLTEIDRKEFNKERKDHWKARAENLKNEMSFKGRITAANEVGLKSGVAAAGLTAAISTVENIRGVISGDIEARDAVANIAKETGSAGATGYGVGFVSTAVAKTMTNSSNKLFQSLGKANVPAAVIAVGIKSYDSVIDYAQGNISGEKLAIDLGKNTTGVLGGAVGSALAGAALGSVVPGAGTVAGFAVGLVGGMVGYIVGTGAYATAIEVATDGTGVLADKAEAAAENAEILRNKAIEMGQSVIDSVASSAPEAVDDVKDAMNDFAASLGAPIHL